MVAHPSSTTSARKRAALRFSDSRGNEVTYGKGGNSRRGSIDSDNEGTLGDLAPLVYGPDEIAFLEQHGLR